MRRMTVVAAVAVTMTMATTAGAVEVYGQGGTQGLGLGVGTGLDRLIPGAPSAIGLRADINAMPTFHHHFSSGNIAYSGRATIRSANGYLDLFPFSGSAFRLTTGIVVNDDHVDGEGMYQQGAITAGGRSYSLAGQQVHGRVRYPAVMPYLGLGFGHKTTVKGLSLFGDLGVAFGRPRVDLDYPVNATTASLPADVVNAANAQLASERNELQHTVDRYRVFPVLTIGLSYRF